MTAICLLQSNISPLYMIHALQGRYYQRVQACKGVIISVLLSLLLVLSMLLLLL